MTLAVKRLIRDAALRLPELAHVRSSRVLVVAGEAKGTSRATIRSGGILGKHAGSRRHFIRLRGRRILYVITLRPVWFAASTPEERVATILHELYHTSTLFDGKLHRARRHARLPRVAYGREVRSLLGRYLARAPDDVLAPFAREGEVKVRMWLRMPRPSEAATFDVDENLFHAFMPLCTKLPSRARSRTRKARRRVSAK
ncbi:MAG TPA: putative metallopeptidase [Anaeromyxobacteraceae bacterium]|nr:putative metallopeptidase [Anaeromyxobacteraceae bacterium]